MNQKKTQQISAESSLGRMMGIEPTSVGATIRCVYPFATAAMNFFALTSLLNQSLFVKKYLIVNTKKKDSKKFESN